MGPSRNPFSTALACGALTLACASVGADGAGSPAILLLGVLGYEEKTPYRTLLVSTDPAVPLSSIPALVVPGKDGFLRVDIGDGVLSVVPLGLRPRYRKARDGDPSCYHSSGLLYAGPKYVSVTSSYECTSPSERTASGNFLATLSIDRLFREHREIPVSISEALGPSAPSELEAAARARLNGDCISDPDGKWSSETSWAITRVSMQEQGPGDARPNALAGHRTSAQISLPVVHGFW